MAGSVSGSEGRKPIHCVPPVALRPGRKDCAFFSIASALRKFGGRSSPPSSTAPPTRMPLVRRVTTKPCPPKVTCVRRSKAPGGSVVL